MKHFCTYFDSRYLTRGLALYESLVRFCSPFRLFVLCMDDVAWDTLRRLNLPSLEPVRVQDLEAADPELAAARATRSTVEYYFTTTPAFPLFLMRKHPDIAFLTYLDADLWFFAGIDPLFDELGDGAVAIIAHRFPKALAYKTQYGIYNVGCVIFRNDPRGRAVLESWRGQCIEWCYDRLEPERFADQKYLDRWPAAFDGVTVIQHKGANVAPWNVDQYRVHAEGTTVLIDDAPLLFYHFHRLRQRAGGLWELGLQTYKARARREVVDLIYRPYIAALHRETARIKELLGGNSLPIAIPRYSLTPLDLLRTPFRFLSGELIIERP